MPYNDNLDVSLLLGLNCTRAIKPREIIPGNDDNPYAKRTAVGWGIIGMTTPDATGNHDGVRVNRIVSREVLFTPRKICHFALKTHTREILTLAQVNHLFELDFNEPRLADKPFRTKTEPSCRKSLRAYIKDAMVIMRCPCRSNKNQSHCLATSK